MNNKGRKSRSGNTLNLGRTLALAALALVAMTGDLISRLAPIGRKMRAWAEAKMADL
jgi:hypothetical protein